MRLRIVCLSLLSLLWLNIPNSSVIAQASCQDLASSGLSVQPITLRHEQVSNPGTWQTTSETIDGNIVRVQTTVNNSSAARDLTLRLSEVASSNVLYTATRRFDAGDNSIFYAWDTLGYAWETSNLPQSAREICVEVLANGSVIASASSDIIVKPRPAILIHGWNEGTPTPEDGSWRAYLGATGFLQSAHPQWQGYYVTGMNTGSFSVAGDDAIVNAEQAVRPFVATVREQTNAWHVDMLGYSMGGLIGRAYLHHFMEADPSASDDRPIVYQLVTLAAPHAGSSCASNLYAGNSIEAFFLSPEYMWRFNQVITNYNGTRVTNIIGTPYLTTCLIGISTNYNVNVCSSVFTIANFEGRGDFVVSATSAFSVPAVTEATTGSTHSSGLGFTPITQSQADFDNHVLPQLALSYSDLSALPPARAFAPPVYAPVRDASAAVPQVLEQRRLTLDADSTTTFTVTVDSAEALTLILAAEADIAFTLTSPSGSTTTGTLAAERLFQTENIIAPERGTWRLTLQNTATTAQPVIANVLVEAPLPPERQLTAPQNISVCSDTDNDSIVTPTDVIYVLNRLGSRDILADADFDGDVDITDAQAISAALGE